MVQGSRQWHEKLPFALLGYRTTVRTSTGATPYLLVYGTEAVIPTEVEILSLQVIVEAEIDDDEWVEAKGKFSPNWQGLFIVKKVLPNGALYLTDIEGKMAKMAINADAVKRYYVKSVSKQARKNFKIYYQSFQLYEEKPRNNTGKKYDRNSTRNKGSLLTDRLLDSWKHSDLGKECTSGAG
ncbi:hypothetical protein BC332_29862 [Capsicum chinense]|nr:hypothetical protein BC332_29862 [Capsicum chinense]